jgi:hypothetical protein
MLLFATDACARVRMTSILTSGLITFRNVAIQTMNRVALIAEKLCCVECAWRSRDHLIEYLIGLYGDHRAAD